MSAQSRAAQNRANAQSSTGPKSAAGKARVAQNARRHGATGRPRDRQVALWLRIILDAPDFSMGDLLAAGERERCALALAEAEVRLIQAEQALAAFEASKGTETPEFVAIQQEIAKLLEAMAEGDFPGNGRETGFALLKELGQAQRRQIQRDKNRGPLLERYQREARTRRKRCFREWIGMLKTPRPQRGGTDPEVLDFPKQSHIQLEVVI